MIRIVGAFLLALIFSLSPPVLAAQEEPPLTLRLSRDFGYGSGAQMQGRFSYRIEAPDSVVRVEFLLDGEIIGEDTEPPFRLAFTTGSYEEGWHTLSAVGYTATGEILAANSLQRQFVPVRQSFLATGGILLLVVAFVVVRYLFTRPRGTDAQGRKRRGYGLLGGAVCPRCGRPFPLQLWSVNLAAGRITRCPHCGKWSFVQRASPQALAAAEAFEAELDAESELTPGGSMGEEERLRRRLENSRYEE